MDVWIIKKLVWLLERPKCKNVFDNHDVLTSRILYLVNVGNERLIIRKLHYFIGVTYQTGFVDGWEFYKGD